MLRNGRTAHKTFKLPLNLNDNENATCNVTPNSDVGKLLKNCSVIVWDEAPMVHKHGFEALNRCLQDIRKNNKIMGNVLVILAGDFRQILPIVKGGTKYDEIKVMQFYYIDFVTILFFGHFYSPVSKIQYCGRKFK